MQTYIDQLSKHVKVGRQIALVIDNARWHKWMKHKYLL